MGVGLFSLEIQRSCQASQQASVLGEEGSIWGPKRTRIPDFDRPAIAGRDNLGSIRGKRHRIDVAAVGVGLLALQLERTCQGSQTSSVLAKEGRFEAQHAPESQTLIV